MNLLGRGFWILMMKMLTVEPILSKHVPGTGRVRCVMNSAQAGRL
jgi:hypothetical protein